MSFSHSLETTLHSSTSQRPHLQTRAVDFIHCLRVVSSPRQNVLFHLEFQTTIVLQYLRLLPRIIFCHQQWRLTLLDNIVLHVLRFSHYSLFAELCEIVILREKLVVQRFSSSDSFLGIFLEKSFHEVKPFIEQNLHVLGRFRYYGSSKLILQALF